LKRRRDDDEDKDKEPSTGPDRGSKRRREGKEPESASTPLETATKSAGRVDTLTPELLAGPTYELMKGSCKSLIELEYHLEEVYKAITDQLDWFNHEGQQYPQNLLQPLPLIPDNREEPIYYDKKALWGVSHWGHKRQQFYGFIVNRESTRDVYSKRKIVAVMKLKIVEWHSYNDGTLNDVRTALDDRLKRIKIRYLPQTIWRKSDKDRAVAMIQAIDKMLKTRRVMRSLERFVGGRLYEGDFKILQRTI
nr:hypothetical protein [Tanacetum cinerariifolium]